MDKRAVKIITLLYISVFTILLPVSAIVFISCHKTSDESSEISDKSIYLYFDGEKNGYKIWIVNGEEVRKKYCGEFIYGGNSERYTFIPQNEIWIDNAISAEEMETTVAHEIKEQKLMNKYGMLYSDAHDSALALEVTMRNKWKEIAKEHEDNLDSVTPRDFDSTMEIVTLPEKIKLRNVYRIPLDKINGMNIWVVDGYTVRRDIFPDFGFSGNDKEYFFIPEGEIWIDGQISCFETGYSETFEINERNLMSKGINYNDAYNESLTLLQKLKSDNDILTSQQPAIIKTEPSYRDKGTGSGNN